MNKLILYIKKNKIAIIITTIIFSGCPPWLIWSVSAYINYILCFILFYICLPRITKLGIKIWATFFFLIIPIFLVYPLIFGWHTSNIFIAITFLSCCTLRKDELLSALRIVTNVLALLLLISLPLWLTHVFVHNFVPISSIDLSNFKGVDSGDSVIMNNFIFFVTLESLSDAYRFYSVFDEPGVLGTLGAFILFANKYNFSNWRVIMILIGCFFTYSLAFYVLTIVGFAIINFKKPKRLLCSLIILVPVILVAVIGLKDNVGFKQAIIDRFTENSMTDNLELRNSGHLNDIFNSYINTPQAIIGIGHYEMEQMNLLNGASYKNFILEYGILGLITVIICYRQLAGRKPNIYCWGALLMVIMSFLQRPQLWTTLQLLVFSCTIASLKNHVPQKRILR